MTSLSPTAISSTTIAHYTIASSVSVAPNTAAWLTVNTVIDAQSWVTVLNDTLYLTESGLYLVNFATKYTDDPHDGTYRSTIVNLETSSGMSIWNGGGPVTVAPGAVSVANYGWANNWPFVWVPPFDGPIDNDNNYAYLNWQVAHDSASTLTLEPTPNANNDGVLVEIHQLATFV